MKLPGTDKFRDWFKDSENAGLGMLIVLFFLALSVFWTLKPIRKSLFIGQFKEDPLSFLGMTLGGAQAEQLAKLSMVGIALIVALVLPRLVRVLSLRQILVLVSMTAAAGFGVSAFLVGEPTASFVWSFYLFGDFVNSLIITLLWMLIHNTMDQERARKTYGAIGIGIVAGGVFGSFFVYSGIETLGREAIIGFSIVPTIAIGLFGYKVACSLGKKGGSTNNCLVVVDDPPNRRETQKFETWSRKLLSSRSYRYWIGIAALVALYEISSGIIDFQLSVAVEQINASGYERDMYFGLIGQVQSMLALLIQVFVTGWVLKRWGLGVALLILPFVTLLGSVGFLLIPTLVSAMILSVSDNALNYSVNQSAKETLYVPTKSRERIAAKPIIDLFVQRFAKSFAIALNLILVTQVSLENVRWLSLLGITIMISWIFVARYTSREFELLALDDTKLV